MGRIKEVFIIAKSRLGGLGKGLDALFVDNNTSNHAVTLNINEIEPNKDQPRKFFGEDALAELADSIKQHGVLQPLLVRPLPNGRYQLIAGERRWRASRMAGITDLPVVIREMTDNEAMELALIENLQREDLNPVEEALGYRQLMDSYGMTQEKVAASVGKSRPAIANALRILHLPVVVLDMLQNNEISAGHAKALLSLEDEALIVENAQKVRSDRMTVRDIEELAKKRKKGFQEENPVAHSPILSRAGKEKTFYAELALSMEEELGRRVAVRVSGKEGGNLTVEFFDKQDLCDMVSRLTGQPCAFTETETCST